MATLESLEHKAASAPDAAYSTRDQDAAIEAYLETFYVVENGIGNFVVNNTERTYPGELNFWKMAEEIEMVEDAFDRTQDTRYSAVAESLIRGFIKVHGADWSWNKYNDDLMWITMACLRAHLFTGNPEFYDIGKSCFDSTWLRAYDTEAGGVWWTTDNGSKNACILGPTAIAAALMYQCGGGDEYLDRALTVFNWEKNALYHDNGLIQDSITPDGVCHGGALSYNQGTFIGAAHLLNVATKTTDFERCAVAATEYAREHCTGQNAPGVFWNEYHIGDGDNDGAGFKGIFARWCGKWIRETGHDEFLPWLRLNAQTVVDQRNSKGLSWGIWGKPTPDGPLAAWECSGSVALLQNIPPAKANS